MRKLVEQAVFGPNAKMARAKIKKQAKQKGIVLSSLQNIYEKIAKGEINGFTVPAFNFRTLTFDAACALFRAAKKQNVGFFAIELARSEIEYTKQTPEEYAVCILGAALAENFRCPVFLQGDHYNLKDKSRKEAGDLKKLIKQAIKAGFYNIDIDGSHLINVDKKTILEQQRDNILKTAEFVSFIRKNQPKNRKIAIGGEVSAIGGKETSLEETGIFLTGLINILLKQKQKDGIIKLGLQMATQHGGEVLATGKIKPVHPDFEKLKKLSFKAKAYRLAGVVQHGASTLPDDCFEKFPKAGVCEIHLATQFQNIIFDSPYFPKELKEKIHNWLRENFRDELKNYQTDEQFFYKTRKKALGEFKKDIWQMGENNINKICEKLEAKFLFLFDKLKVEDTFGVVEL